MLGGERAGELVTGEERKQSRLASKHDHENPKNDHFLECEGRWRAPWRPRAGGFHICLGLLFMTACHTLRL